MRDNFSGLNKIARHVDLPPELGDFSFSLSSGTQTDRELANVEPTDSTSVCRSVTYQL